MRKPNLNYAITVKLSEQQRTVIEKLADRKETTLGEATRTLIVRGMEAMKLTA
jgi:hypothetical protein